MSVVRLAESGTQRRHGTCRTQGRRWRTGRSRYRARTAGDRAGPGGPVKRAPGPGSGPGTRSRAGRAARHAGATAAPAEAARRTGRGDRTEAAPARLLPCGAGRPLSLPRRPPAHRPAARTVLRPHGRRYGCRYPRGTRARGAAGTPPSPGARPPRHRSPALPPRRPRAAPPTRAGRAWSPASGLFAQYTRDYAPRQPASDRDPAGRLHHGRRRPGRGRAAWRRRRHPSASSMTTAGHPGGARRTGPAAVRPG